MKTKYDSRVFEYGRYRQNYPRARARSAAIAPGIDEWESGTARSLDGSVWCPCGEDSCADCNRFFQSDPPYRAAREAQLHAPTPVHDHTRVKAPRPPKHVHVWREEEIVKPIERNQRFYYWRHTAWPLSAYPEDPVMQITRMRVCTGCGCHSDKVVRIREAHPHERANIASRREQAKAMTERFERMRLRAEGAEAETPATPVKKRKARKAGRRRK